MSNLVKTMEDKHVKDAKEEMGKSGIEMTHSTEMVMRESFSAGATMFRTIGRHEGDEARKKKIIDALGLITGEPEL